MVLPTAAQALAHGLGKVRAKRVVLADEGRRQIPIAGRNREARRIDQVSGGQIGGRLDFFQIGIGGTTHGGVSRLRALQQRNVQHMFQRSQARQRFITRQRAAQVLRVKGGALTGFFSARGNVALQGDGVGGPPRRRAARGHSQCNGQPPAAPACGVGKVGVAVGWGHECINVRFASACEYRA